MKKVLLTILSTVWILSLFAQESLKLQNPYLTMQVRQGEISLKSKKNPLQVKTICIPGNIVSSTKSEVVDSLWGKAQQIKVACDNGRVSTFRLYSSDPFVHLHTTITNQTDKDICINQLDMAAFEIPLTSGKTSMNTLGTGGLQPVEAAEGSFSYAMLADPANYHAVLSAWLTQWQGIGYMMPKWDAEKHIYTIHAGLEFGNFLVKKGEKRDTDILLIGFFEDGRQGLELYGDYLAKAYQIQLPEKPEVYSTWYHRNKTGSGASNEKSLMENALFIKKNLADYGMNTLQIDDHWQSSMIKGLTYATKSRTYARLNNGPITNFMESNFNYPSGMQSVATRLQQQGFMAGLWFMPFSADVNSPYCNAAIFAKDAKTGLPYTARKWSGTCIDATSPLGEAFLRDRFRRIFQWGYHYLKIDGLHTGAPSENVYIQRAYQGKPIFGKAILHDVSQTFVQCFRKGLGFLREEAPNAFLLGCSATQNMSSFAASFGLVDAMRVGPDNDGATVGKWSVVTRGADYASNLYFFHNKVWYNDPDPYYVRESNPLPYARWMISWQAVSGAMNSTSIQYADLSQERLDLLKRALPTHHLNARPVDILESSKPRIWIVGNERMSIVGLFNWSDTDSTQINYPLQQMGLNKTARYEVFDFWKNTYEGSMSGKLVDVLEPAGCRVLAIRRTQSYPQVISTSRHITQGLIDITEEDWDKVSGTLSGTSKVVAKDVYELRVILPQGFDIEEASFDGSKGDVKIEGRLARISFIPTTTGEIPWKIKCY